MDIFLTSFALFLFIQFVFLGLQRAIFTAGKLSGYEGWSLARILSLAALTFWTWISYLLSLPSLVILAVPLLFILTIFLLPRKAPTENCPYSLNLLQICVAFGVFVLLCGIESYSGGGWCSDQIEHFERTNVFLYNLSAGDGFLEGMYHFTARPPGGNALAAFFLIPTQSSFSNFQIVMAVLGAELLWGIFLFISLFVKKREIPFLTASLLCLLSPVFLQNALFPWTKSIAALFVVGSISCLYGYLIREKKQQILFFGILLGMGILVHYSAAVFLPGAALILLGRMWRDRKTLRLSEILSALIPGALAGFIIIGSWIFWAANQYDFDTILGSTTTVSSTEEKSFTEYAVKVSLNIRNTVIPYYYRDLDWATQTNTHGTASLPHLRDMLFNLFQTNLIFFGGFSAILVFPALTISRRFRLTDRISFTEVSVIYFSAFLFGIAVLGTLDQIGVAHICLQPLLYLAIAYLSIVFNRLSLVTKVFLTISLLGTLVYGIGLHLYLLGWSPFDWFTMLYPHEGPLQIYIESGYATMVNMLNHLNLGLLPLGAYLKLNFFVTFGIYLLIMAAFLWKIITNPRENR